jgi:hypothetical protein
MDMAATIVTCLDIQIHQLGRGTLNLWQVPEELLLHQATMLVDLLPRWPVNRPQARLRLRYALFSLEYSSHGPIVYTTQYFIANAYGNVNTGTIEGQGARFADGTNQRFSFLIPLQELPWRWTMSPTLLPPTARALVNPLQTLTAISFIDMWGI